VDLLALLDQISIVADRPWSGDERLAIPTERPSGRGVEDRFAEQRFCR